MKTFAKTLMAGAALAVATAGSVNAHDTGNSNLSIKNTFGNVVETVSGDCVVTSALVANGGCTALNSEALTLYFDFNSAALTSASRTKLNTVVSTLREAGGSNDIDVVGFADEIGNADYNTALSKRRANTVKSYLSRRGLNIGSVDLRGLGESSSVSSCNGKSGGELRSCLWRDRRVELEIN